MHELTKNTIDLILEGGPLDLPESFRVRRADTVEDKIKIPHRGGYEHFELADGPRTGRTQLVYHWTMRTKIAE